MINEKGTKDRWEEYFEELLNRGHPDNPEEENEVNNVMIKEPNDGDFFLFGGKRNGQEYPYRVRAQNKKGKPQLKMKVEKKKRGKE